MPVAGSSPPRPDGNAARRASTSRQVLDAAAALMAERGYAETSLDAVAERAGVAKGSIYYNFGSKATLFTSLIDHTMSGFSEALRRAAAGRTGTDALDAVICALLTQVRDNPAGTKVLASELFRTGRTWQESLRPVREEIVSVFRQVIVDADPTADAYVAAPAAFGATLIAGLEWRTFQPDRPLSEIAGTVLASVRGVLPPDAATPTD
ncbi:TetR/AcrR family transcriptional regulator [Actinotalea sp. K2]|uniref:TetR/AcrR family transcriptional regulator n=1 Tax=Actinotalea sp. K2 TaxID=2939438 RepID=UPI002017D572|nr:TetR/AcrR family transcriptional regulator [Actinotalea sp. K2]MCL3862010.1 TetR/AcrR family transcriptional regulator [Actinotalea sp. K2]